MENADHKVILFVTKAVPNHNICSNSAKQWTVFFLKNLIG